MSKKHHSELLADLHMHSTASDGGYSPSQLMEKCINNHLSIVSLTDHDTTAGVIEAMKVAKEHHLRFIPGIELSTRIKNTHVDILGYGIDPHNKSLLSTITFHQQMRIERMKTMIEKSNEQGLSVTFNEVAELAKGDTFSRPHLAQTYVKKGYVKDVKEAFDLYLANGKPCYVEKEDEMTPQEAIELVHQAEGIAIVAHPIFYSLDEDIFEWLTVHHLDGIEVYHRDHDDDAIDRFLKLANRAEVARGKKVFITGGSDFHHESFGREGENIGITKLPYEIGEQIYKAVRNKI
ncbi:PHP domain-containing protein [Evansella cellulosilytica]|uniref:PHP domain protein n=1 Tax=Evansella cellulosilytica (strain ATCC 21833 / DSM 2522 / FERM P-1141 / JCM 9156 / N-4) TaxID=649639 RepID=E6U241_EVAC2|nr:PHP domain-containing protein [Evansella cellulosilytica]ADU30419.1 PHP domain protein [Evansella cellulosilytica DSM 2522]